ncbi:YceI family protein [Corynebacterium sp. HS2168-gen11]|uniref:YceI family protein n=1 Tax=Corynebacterium sp. HS2168-gen11 TaxID=2974027 RepID=UPI00216AB640|nr:YceI family protein [Corynebacterium sp. HS2168-gen11]MCS4536151.1 YceI family protein [Corynebacterium sp. HS2168-gen11]
MSAYVFDAAHTTIGFVARHAMITKVRGKFAEFDASFDLEAGTATAAIKADSFTTGNADRDAHVKGEDFFNVAEFPELSFTATSFNIANNEGTVTGDLTIKGITREVTLNVEFSGPAEDPWGNSRLGVEATTTINRKDFGIDFNAPLNTGGVLISEEIKIEIDGSAIKQA